MKETLYKTEVRPRDVFDPWDGEPIRNWEGLTLRLDEILKKHGKSQLVWRGVSDSSWGLHSSLYRRLRQFEPEVSENDMITFEKKVLQEARSTWRFESMNPLEIFAHIQHYGGPTRLLDVTINPLIAVWFAVERKWDENFEEINPEFSRVFCFYADKQKQSELASNEEPFWHDWTNQRTRVDHKWGTNELRRFWRPAVFNERIAAQNAGFIIDGAPITSGKAGTFSRFPGDKAKWGIYEIRDVSSIPITLNNHLRAKQKESSRPVFSFKIENSARKEIRSKLENNFGYTAGSLYSDMFGLANHVLKNFL